MLKRTVPLHVTKEEKEFCDFMEYSFLERKGDFFLYEIPANHICRFKLNFQMWKQGAFNKEKFLTPSEVI